MRCMSASSIASTTCSRCSAAPRARSARPTSTSASSSGPAFGPPPFFLPISGNFALKTQTSHDVEGGFRIKSGGFQMQTSIYNMDLENEIHFNPGAVLQLQPRPDPALRHRRPPHRCASATACCCAAASPSPARCSAKARLPAMTCRWCRATPPVPASPGTSGRTIWCWMPRCAAGASASWTTTRPTPRTLHRRGCDGRSQAVRRLSIISSGRSRVNNLLNALYYDYAIASTFTPGRFSAYPLPGRSYLVKAGVTF